MSQAHDFTEGGLSSAGHRAKDETRRRPLDVVKKHSALLWSKSTNSLRYDWMELAGSGAPTLEMLLREEALNGEGKFIGVDREASIIAGCKQKYGPHAPAVWREGQLSEFANANHPDMQRVGVLVFDSEDGIWRGKWSDLEQVTAFAKLRAAKIGEFALVVNAVAPPHRLKPGDMEKYRKRLSDECGVAIKPEALTPYTSKTEQMVWTMVTFGF